MHFNLGLSTKYKNEETPLPNTLIQRRWKKTKKIKICQCVFKSNCLASISSLTAAVLQLAFSFLYLY